MVAFGTPAKQSERKIEELWPCTLRATGELWSLHGQAHVIAARAARIAAADCMTVAEALRCPGYALGDLRYDIRCGYLSVHEPQLGAVAPDPPPQPQSVPTRQRARKRARMLVDQFLAEGRVSEASGARKRGWPCEEARQADIDRRLRTTVTCGMEGGANEASAAHRPDKELAAFRARVSSRK